MKKFPQAYEEKTKFKYIGVEHLNRIKTVYNDSVSLKPLKNNRKKNQQKTFRISIQIFQVLMTCLRFFLIITTAITTKTTICL